MKISFNSVGAKAIGVILVFMTIMMNFSISTISASNPWEPYSQFIPKNTPVVKRHLRGMWISTVVNLDWPAGDTRKITDDNLRIQKSKEELIELLDKAIEMNFNAIFLQVSPEADALYKSQIVPWSRYLTGTFGKDPGFDPLEFAISEAHKRNLEIHAWFNPYRVSVDIKAETKASMNIDKSVYKEHPEWVKTSMSRFIVDPGIPEARKWVIDRVMEVVDNYDIDGVHFDDYFYYEKTEYEMKDDDTFAKYNDGRFANIGDFRRDNTYTLVKELSNKIRESGKTWVKFGISPAGVWGNKSDGHSQGSSTNSPFTNYDRSFADTKKWVEEELIDYIAPQIYFSFGNPRAPYGEVASWWSSVVKGKKVHLYIGQPLYKINDDSDSYFKGNNAVPEFERQLKYNMAKPEILGTIMFRAKNLYDSGKQGVVNSIKNNLWKNKALIPVMSWKGGKAPLVPNSGTIDSSKNNHVISWSDYDSTTSYFAIYRFKPGEKVDIKSDLVSSKLIATLRKTGDGIHFFEDKGVRSTEDVFYVVTSLDRLHNESMGLTIDNERSKYFYDVGRSFRWAIDSVDRFYENSIITGDGKGKFNPSLNTKRGDFIIMLVKALKLKSSYNSNFGDVKKQSYYYDSIGIAKASGIVKGNGTNFNPEGNITREDMMVIVLSALQKKGVALNPGNEEDLKEYKDNARISNYAKEAVATLVKNGVVKGSDNMINPKSMANRAEIAVLLDKVLSQFK